MRDLKEGRLELDLDLVHEANGLLEKAQEVLGDGKTPPDYDL